MRDSILVQHQVVLHWHENNQMRNHEGHTIPGEPQLFTDADEAAPYGRAIDGDAYMLTWNHWQNMGGPDRITVTVQPGDTLNHEGN